MKYFMATLLIFNSCSSLASNRCEDVFVAKEESLGIKLDKLLSKNDPWDFTEEQENLFSRIMKDDSKSLSERVEELFIEITEERLKKLPPLSQSLTRAAYRGALSQDSIYSRTLGRSFLWFIGPHYNQIFNRVAIHKDESELGRSVRAFLAAHLDI